MTQKLKWIVIVVVMIFAAFWIWYEYTYSMDTVIPFSINDPKASTKVLIASQGSRFKDSLVQSILKQYKNDTIYFKVIDAYLLFTTPINKWDAIVIINSWEYGMPPKNVRDFIKKHPDQTDKLIILSTVGSYNMIFDQIDTISGESIIEKVPDYTEVVINQLNEILIK